MLSPLYKREECLEHLLSLLPACPAPPQPLGPALLRILLPRNPSRGSLARPSPLSLLGALFRDSPRLRVCLLRGCKHLRGCKRLRGDGSSLSRSCLIFMEQTNRRAHVLFSARPCSGIAGSRGADSERDSQAPGVWSSLRPPGQQVTKEPQPKRTAVCCWVPRNKTLRRKSAHRTLTGERGAQTWGMRQRRSRLPAGPPDSGHQGQAFATSRGHPELWAAPGGGCDLDRSARLQQRTATERVGPAASWELQTLEAAGEQVLLSCRGSACSRSAHYRSVQRSERTCTWAGLGALGRLPGGGELKLGLHTMGVTEWQMSVLPVQEGAGGYLSAGKGESLQPGLERPQAHPFLI